MIHTNVTALNVVEVRCEHSVDGEEKWFRLHVRTDQNEEVNLQLRLSDACIFTTVPNAVEAVAEIPTL